MEGVYSCVTRAQHLKAGLEIPADSNEDPNEDPKQRRLRAVDVLRGFKHVAYTPGSGCLTIAVSDEAELEKALTAFLDAENLHSAPDLMRVDMERIPVDEPGYCEADFMAARGIGTSGDRVATDNPQHSKVSPAKTDPDAGDEDEGSQAPPEERVEESHKLAQPVWSTNREYVLGPNHDIRYEIGICTAYQRREEERR